MQEHPEYPKSDEAESLDQEFAERLADVERRAQKELELLEKQQPAKKKPAEFSKEASVAQAFMPIYTMIGALLVGFGLGWMVDGFRFGAASTIGAFVGAIGGTALVIVKLTRK
jgi:F0F1-type ATP synthase assembly protein I